MDRKQMWAYMAMANFSLLSILGMAILEYSRTNYMDWYDAHPAGGPVAVVVGVSAWLLLTAQTSIHLHMRSRRCR